MDLSGFGSEGTSKADMDVVFASAASVGEPPPDAAPAAAPLPPPAPPLLPPPLPARSRIPSSSSPRRGPLSDSSCMEADSAKTGEERPGAASGEERPARMEVSEANSLDDVENCKRRSSTRLSKSPT